MRKCSRRKLEEKTPSTGSEGPKERSHSVALKGSSQSDRYSAGLAKSQAMTGLPLTTDAFVLMLCLPALHRVPISDPAPIDATQLRTHSRCISHVLGVRAYRRSSEPAWCVHVSGSESPLRI